MSYLGIYIGSAPLASAPSTTAVKLVTPHSISLTGDGVWSTSFDGSADVSGALSLASSGVSPGTFGAGDLIPVITVDGKGRITSISTSPVIGGGGGGGGTVSWGTIINTPTTITGYGITDAVPVNSPTFTGVPNAPTASLGTNTTQVATTAFVSNANALKAPLASPALTGVPTAPTAALGTNTTQIATTAFALANAAQYQLGVGQSWQNVTNSRTANTTYYNTTSKPIFVLLSASQYLNLTLTFKIDNHILPWSNAGSVTAISDAVSFIIPVGSSYSSNHNVTWLELR